MGGTTPDCWTVQQVRAKGYPTESMRDCSVRLQQQPAQTLPIVRPVACTIVSTSQPPLVSNNSLALHDNVTSPSQLNSRRRIIWNHPELSFRRYALMRLPIAVSLGTSYPTFSPSHTSSNTFAMGFLAEFPDPSMRTLFGEPPLRLDVEYHPTSIAKRLCADFAFFTTTNTFSFEDPKTVEIFVGFRNSAQQSNPTSIRISAEIGECGGWTCSAYQGACWDSSSWGSRSG